MNSTLKLALGLALAIGAAAPAFAQSNPAPVPQNNASLEGSEGPASNSAGYPSAQSQGGSVATTNVGPQVATGTKPASN